VADRPAEVRSADRIEEILRGLAPFDEEE